MGKRIFAADIGGTTVKLGMFTVEGELLDQWEIYRQFNGLSKPLCTVTIDDVIPQGL